MAIAFLSPWWLIAAVVVAGLALLAVWWLGLTPMPASTLRFWQSAAGSAGRQDSRNIDPLWLLVAVATTLAALALLQPILKTFPSRSAMPPPPSIIAAGAAIPQAQTGSIFVRSRRLIKSSGPVRLDISWLGGRRIDQISPRQLQAGVTVADLPISAKVWNIALIAAGDTFWRQTLKRHTPATVAVNFLGPPPRPLVRLFRLAKGVALNRLGLHPALWILNSAGSKLGRRSLARGDVVLAIAPAVFPGMSLDSPDAIALSRDQAMPPLHLEKTTSSGLLEHLRMNQIGFRIFYKAHLRASWKVLLTATGRGLGSHPWPFLAQRYDKNGNVWEFWLAVPLNFRSTHWPQHGSFVIFFANLLQRLRSGSTAGESMTRWLAPATLYQPGNPVNHGPPRRRVIPLAGWLALVAVGLVAVAMVGFVRRIWPVRTTP